MKNIEQLLDKIGYQPQAESLFQLAMTHRSFSKTNNERLEYIGDAALDLIIAEALFIRFPEATEGELSHLRSLLVKGESLAQLALANDLNQIIKLGQGEKNSGGDQRPSILADAFEALIGAIYLDSDFATCKQLVLSLFADRLKDVLHQQAPKDAKTTLQEYLQSKRISLPVYTLIKTTGKQHKQTFIMSCSVPELKKTAEATGHSKKVAEQQAAHAMMQLLQPEKFPS